MTLTVAPRNIECVSFALLVNHKWLLSDQALAFSLFVVPSFITCHCLLFCDLFIYIYVCLFTCIKSVLFYCISSSDMR